MPEAKQPEQTMRRPTSARKRFCRAQVKHALLVFLWVAGSPSSALADDYTECVAAYQRYNANIGELIALPEGGRSGPCRAIKPEVGFAACENFIKSGDGTQAKRDWASQVSDNLSGVYQKCQAQ
jgi:hypothetical protein